MPGMYRGQDYDVAGIAIGALCEDQWKLGQPSLVAGDVVLGLTTSGLQHQDFEILQDILTQNCMSVHKVKGVNGGMTLGKPSLIFVVVYTS